MSARVAVLGGGLSGLAHAHFLRKQLGPAASITVYEASNRLGGFIESIRFPSRQSGRDYLFERGCRGFGKSPFSLYVFQLIQDLGLEDQVIFIPPSSNRRYVLHNGEMFPIPTGLRSVLSSPLATGATAAILRDRFFSKPCTDGDESVYDFFRARFGQHIVKHLIDPVVTSTYGADLKDMSMAATFPLWFPEMARQGSVMSALRSGPTTAFEAATKDVLPSEFIQMGMSSPGMSFVAGTDTLIDALEHELTEDENSTILTGTPVEALERAAGGGLVVHAGGCASEEYTHVTSTIAADQLVDILPRSCAVARDELDEIDFSSFWVVNLGYAEPMVHIDGIGYFTPMGQGSPASRVMFDSNIFPQQASGPDTRISVLLGREFKDELRERTVEEVANLAADTIASQLRNDELATPDAADAAYARHGYALPAVGVLDRMDKVYAEVDQQLPGLHLLGSGLHGPEAPFCVAAAFRQAKEIGRKVRLADTQARAEAQARS